MFMSVQSELQTGEPYKRFERGVSGPLAQEDAKEDNSSFCISKMVSIVTKKNK